MTAALKMLSPATCEVIDRFTSSPESADGLLPFVLPDGLTISPSGLVAALASLSARQVRELGLRMSGIYGPPCTTSSASASLQSSLESRLRARTQNLGSTLYTLTWKAWVTPSGVSRSRLRASVRRTSETATTGWPTPTTRDWKDGAECQNVPINALLGRAAWLAGWPTPTVGNSNGSQSCEGMSATGRMPDGRKVAVALPHVASMAGWPTPTARDHFPAHSEEYIAAKKAQGHGMANLNDLVQQANGSARLTANGELLTGSPAETESGGQLNPAHSRWLMGYPPEWDDCAVTATPLSPRKLRSSSAPTSKPEKA